MPKVKSAKISFVIETNETFRNSMVSPSNEVYKKSYQEKRQYVENLLKENTYPYEIDLDHLIGLSVKSRRHKSYKENKKEHPARPQNSFFIFRRIFDEQACKNEDTKVKDVSIDAGTEWEKWKSTDFGNLIEHIAILAEKFHRCNYPNYKYQPQKKSPKRTTLSSPEAEDEKLDPLRSTETYGLPTPASSLVSPAMHSIDGFAGSSGPDFTLFDKLNNQISNLFAEDIQTETELENLENSINNEIYATLTLKSSGVTDIAQAVNSSPQISTLETHVISPVSSPKSSGVADMAQEVNSSSYTPEFSPVSSPESSGVADIAQEINSSPYISSPESSGVTNIAQEANSSLETLFFSSESSGVMDMAQEVNSSSYASSLENHVISSVSSPESSGVADIAQEVNSSLYTLGFSPGSSSESSDAMDMAQEVKSSPYTSTLETQGLSPVFSLDETQQMILDLANFNYPPCFPAFDNQHDFTQQMVASQSEFATTPSYNYNQQFVNEDSIYTTFDYLVYLQEQLWNDPTWNMLT
ncbi:7664_t:CDS:1 [Acaulospora morrowiae]|uniref:7664_t:CDS:1 n=1 Tax=Acaulospora morrowiae TaxID=94023 RepID=A0A9N9FPW6_9GLOM|nr:7664_t:CDS:1 [Acaulospora morrowiae]